MFFNFSAYTFGDKKNIKFWKDSCCEAQPLSQKFPDVFPLSLNKDAFVAECWCTVSHSWNLGLRRNVLDSEFGNLATIMEILHLWAPNGKLDSLKWKLNASGTFTAKSTLLNQKISHCRLSPGVHYLED